MSVQEQIDFALSEDNEFLQSFNVVGEIGDANVPVNVHVRFYDCQIGTLTLNGGNGIFLEGGSVEAVEATKSRLAARNTAFTGDANMDECDIDLYNGGMSGGKWKLENNCHMRASYHTFRGGEFGIEAKDGSHVRITGGSFQTHTDSAVKSEGSSYVMLINCEEVKGQQKALWTDDKGIIEAVSCGTIEGESDKAAICENSGRIEIRTAQTVKGATDCIEASTRGSVILTDCLNIIGNGGYAVSLESNARADIRKFQTMQGKGDHAIILDNSFMFISEGGKVQSNSDNAVDSTSGTLELVDVGVLLGQTDGVSATSESRISLMRVSSVTGQSGDGVNISSESRLTLVEVQSITGNGGTGLVAASESKIDAYDCPSIMGQAEDGVALSSESIGTFKKAGIITGNGGDGIKLSSESRLIIMGADVITGSSGHGIIASANSRIHAKDVSTITGASDTGITVSGGGALHLDNITTISGSGSHGILMDGVVAHLRNVDSTSGGGGNGIDAVDPVEITLERCALFQGSESGMRIVGRGANEGFLRIAGPTDCLGSDMGLDLASIRAETQGLTVQGSKSVKLQNVHMYSTKDQWNGDTDAVDSILHTMEVRINGEVNYTRTQIIDAAGNHGSFMTLDQIGAVLVGTKLPGGDAIDSGVMASRANIGPTTLDKGGWTLNAGAADMKGEGSVVSVNSTQPEPGVDAVYLGEDDVTIQSQSLSVSVWSDTLTHFSPVSSTYFATEFIAIRSTDVNILAEEP